jgi:hypothetical protein
MNNELSTYVDELYYIKFLDFGNKIIHKLHVVMNNELNTYVTELYYFKSLDLSHKFNTYVN